MKKTILVAITLFVVSLFASAQNVGIGTNSPNSSAQLEISATNKGLLLPRMGTAAISAIANPAKGLMVMDTSKNLLMFNVGTAAAPNWQSVAFNSGWSLTGNAGTNPAINFIGTTDDQPVVIRQNNIRAGLLTGLGAGGANTSWGLAALNAVNTGESNTALGVQALYFNTTGSGNTATGVDALFSNENGFRNTANGVSALKNNKGFENTAIGFNALFFNTTGNINTATGTYALYSNATGNGNTATGMFALVGNTEGYSNVAIGIRALASNTNRSNLVAIGDSALFSNTDGTENTATGSKALYANVNGFRNTANGSEALFSNLEGAYNTATGAKTLSANTTGDQNSAFGDESLGHNTSGNFNTAVGSSALLRNTSGNSNTAIGDNALFNNLSGSDNIAVGLGAGALSTGSGNVFLGKLAGYSETGNNKLYINNTSAVATDALIYGEFDNKLLTINGRLGIGTTTPHGNLQFTNTLVNRKLVLYEDADNDHQFNGFGVNAFLMRYQIAATTGSHIFYTGTSNTNSKELMRITGNGEVGIGKVPLTSDNDSRLQIKQKGFQNGLGVEGTNGTDHWDFYIDNAASNFNLFYNGIQKGAFDKTTGAYTANSDRRLKKDITPQAPVMNNLLQLQAYQYHYLDNQPTDRFSNGFMAQEVQKIFPDAVVENEMKDGQTRLGINYQYFTVLAIKGLQEQQKEMEELKAQLKLMREELEKLKLK
jgi:trimeric autotransporter adhesin